MKNLVKKGISGARFFLIIGSKAWLTAYGGGNQDLKEQVALAKELKKPVVLMLDEQLTPEEQAKIRKACAGSEIKTEIKFDSASQVSLGNALQSLKKLQEEIHAGSQPISGSSPEQSK